MLRIAVDARPLAHQGNGIHRHVEQLLLRLCQKPAYWHLYGTHEVPDTFCELANVTVRTLNLPARLRGAQLGNLLFARWARQNSIDVYWGTRHQLPPGLPAHIRAVVTVYDMVWKAFGETMRFPGKQIETLLTPPALRRADAIAAISQFTAREINRFVPDVADKTHVVPCGTTMMASPGNPAQAELHNRSGYFLFVGTPEPRKNLQRMIQAYASYVRSAVQPRDLVIVGSGGWGMPPLTELVADAHLQDRVHLLGGIDDNQLALLYANAHALVLVSLYEGFGLPVLEALSAGTPVLVSADSAMAEVAAGSALTVDPYSLRSISEGLLAIDSDVALYRNLLKEIPSRVAHYSWDTSANLMYRLLESRG